MLTNTPMLSDSENINNNKNAWIHDMSPTVQNKQFSTARAHSRCEWSVFKQKKSIHTSGFNFTLWWPGLKENSRTLLNSPAGALLSLSLMFLHPNARPDLNRLGIHSSFVVLPKKHDFQSQRMSFLSTPEGRVDQSSVKQNTLCTALHPQLCSPVLRSCGKIPVFSALLFCVSCFLCEGSAGARGERSWCVCSVISDVQCVCERERDGGEGRGCMCAYLCVNDLLHCVRAPGCWKNGAGARRVCVSQHPGSFRDVRCAHPMASLLFLCSHDHRAPRASSVPAFRLHFHPQFNAEHQSYF